MEANIPNPMKTPRRPLVSEKDAKAIVEKLRKQALGGDPASAAVLLLLPRPPIVSAPFKNLMC